MKPAFITPRSEFAPLLASRLERLRQPIRSDVLAAGAAKMLIVNFVPSGGGWDPINYMVTLGSELLEAEVVEVDTNRISTLERLRAILSRRTPLGHEQESCLLICATPMDLVRILKVPGWWARFRFLAAWIIDSYWLDGISRIIRVSRPFDHLFVTTAEDVDEWTRRTRTRTTWLPWGSDALGLGGSNPARDLDLIRIGRQPPEWDNDTLTAQDAASIGLRFHPRPDHRDVTPIENYRLLMGLYGRSKYLLAFSNSVNPTSFTHPTREYLTGRWVDALACGAIVAGVSPNEPSIVTLLWPGATLELGGVQRAEGLRVLSAALPSWSPAVAYKNHHYALERLDWRWRFKILADTFGETPDRLRIELAAIEERLHPSSTPSPHPAS
jgi:hypothetical protein